MGALLCSGTDNEQWQAGCPRSNGPIKARLPVLVEGRWTSGRLAAYKARLPVLVEGRWTSGRLAAYKSGSLRAPTY